MLFKVVTRAYLIATNLRVIIIKPKRVEIPFTGLPMFKGIVSAAYPYRDISSVDIEEILPFFSKRASNIGFVRLNIRGNETYQAGVIFLVIFSIVVVVLIRLS